jgi:hypothetical protein
MIDKQALIKLDECIKQHIKLYPKLSVKAEQFESLFAQCTNSEWNPYNHNPGKDMETNYEKLKKPNLKSGTIKNDFLKISSHRTTKFKTLDEKLIFLNNVDYDSHICLARPEGKTHSYKLIFFPKSIIDYSKLLWTEEFKKNGEHKGWKGINEDNTIKVSIQKNMSDQVWIEIHKSLFNIIEEYNYENGK